MLQKLHNIFLLLILSIVLIVPVQSAEADLPDGYPLCWRADINKENFCPININLGHKLFLVDFTSRWEPKQVDWIKGRIFGNTITRNTPPYHKITYIKLEETEAESQKVVYSKCRFKTGNKSKKYPGEEYTDECESEDIVKQAHQAWQSSLKKVEETFFDSHILDAKQSLIIEYIANILREPKIDFTGDYPERKLIIVSDLMQKSDRINFYRFCKSRSSLIKPDKCPSFQKLLKKPDVKHYLDTIKPKNVENLKVEIIFMNHSYQTKCMLGKTLIPLWVDLFKYWGINIDPVDDITYELDTKDTC